MSEEKDSKSKSEQSQFSKTNRAVWPLEVDLDPQFTERVKDLEFYTLDNGLRVLQMHDDRDRSFFVKALVNAGAIHQDAKLRGLAHFVEHMVFKGTKNIGDKKELDEFAQDHNLSYNAYTSNISQGFHAQSDAEDEDAEAAVKFVSDVVLNPIFPAAEVELERQVILAERKMYNSDPHEFPFEVLDRHFYDEKHPLSGGGVLGSEQDISAITHEDIVNFHHQHFNANNSLLICSSGLSSSKMRALLTKYFSGAAGNNAWQENKLIGQPRRTTPGNFDLQRDYENVRVFVSHYFPEETTFKFPDKEVFGMEILSYVLSKRVFQDLRDNQGLAYSVWASMADIYHGNALLLSGEFPAEHYAKAREQLTNYAQNLIEEPITTQEFTRAMKNKTSIRWANNAKSVVTSIANNLYKHGQFVSPEYLQDYYNQLDLDYVNNLAKKYLLESTPEVIAVGPVEESSAS